MQIFYKKSTGHLIVTPFRCGSTHLNKSIKKYGLLNITEYEDSDEYKNILSNVKKKTFIYRDPFERWVSFYFGLVYTPRLCELGILDGEVVYKEYNNRIVIPKNIDQMYYNPTSYYDLIDSIKGTEDFWSATYAATKLLKNIIKTSDDRHIFPQHIFFEEYFSKISTDKYEVISIKNYVSWINLTFNDRLNYVSNLSDIYIKLSEVELVNEIRNMCMDIYNKDYTHIFPLTLETMFYNEY